METHHACNILDCPELAIWKLAKPSEPDQPWEGTHYCARHIEAGESAVGAPYLATIDESGFRL